MVQLVGMVDLGNGFRVSAPGMSGEAELLPAGAGAVRAGETVPVGCSARSPVEAALAAACSRVRTVELTPRCIRPPSCVPGGDTGPSIELQVAAAPGQGAVVLLRDETGVLSWHAPRTASRAAPDLLTFRIPVPVAGTVLMGAGGWLKKVLTVGFFDLAGVSIGRVGAFLVNRWEEEARPTRLRRFTPDRYAEPPVITDLINRQDLAALRDGRILLFVHGALGTSHGTFGVLDRREMGRLWARYDGRVIAFDHATLADTPLRSAERLRALLPPVRGNLRRRLPRPRRARRARAGR